MRSPDPGSAPRTPPDPLSLVSLLPVCSPETAAPGLVRTLYFSGGGLTCPQSPRGRSARHWGPLLLGLSAPARSLKKAAAVRSSWPWPLSAAALPWQLAAVNAAASFLHCAGPSGRGTRRGPASGNAACCPLAPQPGGKHLGRQSHLPFLPSPPRAPDPLLPLSSRG